MASQNPWFSSESPFFYYISDLFYEFSFKALFTMVISVASYIVGGFDQLIHSLFMLMIMDFALGFCRGWKTGKISGSKMKHGIMKFILYGAAVYISVHLQTTMQNLNPSVFGLNCSYALRDWLIGYLILNEGLSCLNHCEFFGLPLPKGLLNRIKRYRDCKFDLLGEDRRKKPRKE